MGAGPGRETGQATHASRLDSWRGKHTSVRLVRGSGDPAARGGADPPAGVAVRRAHRQLGAARATSRRAPGARRSSSRATATASCAPSSTSAATAAPSSPRARHARDAAMPVPRVDVRPRRPLRAAPRSDEEPDFPRDELGLVPRRCRHVGAVRLRQRRSPPSRLPTRSARCPRRSRSCLDVDSLVLPRARRPRSPRTGRSSARTSSSATTARSRIPASASSSTSRPERTCSTEGRLSTQRGRAAHGGRREDELPRAQFHFLWPNLGINIFGGTPEHLARSDRPAHPRPHDGSSTTSSRPDVDAEWIDALLAFDDQVGTRMSPSSRTCTRASQRAPSTPACSCMGRSEQLHSGTSSCRSLTFRRSRRVKSLAWLLGQRHIGGQSREASTPRCSGSRLSSPRSLSQRLT